MLCKRTIVYGVFIVLYSQLACSRPTLDELAVKYHTDKSTAWHGYSLIYAKNFEHLRDQPITFLEIGTAGGHSARMWEEYFTHPHTQLLTVDIDTRMAEGVQGLPKTKFYAGNQSDIDTLKQLAESVKEFDIIIDDGSHVSSDQIISFKTLFPYVKRGGIYVVEDLLFSYHPEHVSYQIYERVDYPRPADNSMILFLHSLIDDINYVGARTGCAHIGTTHLKIHWAKMHLNLAAIERELTYYQRYIDRIEFSGSICFIYKKQ